MNIAPVTTRCRSRRRALGQVFTPRPVADWMVRWACANRPRRILDPALGGGVFIDAIEDLLGRRNGHTLPPPRVDVFEIDAGLLDAFRRRIRALPVRCRNEDFITAPLRSPYDAIVANPPYVRHHTMDYGEAVLRRYDALGGRRLSRMTNLYALFLLRIQDRLAPGGRAAVITPAEWLNADFGTAVKTHLLERNALEAILHFDHAARVFDDALTTAAITLLRRGRSTRAPVTLARVRDIDTLRNIDAPKKIDNRNCVRVARLDLDPAQKWTPLFSRTPAAPARSRPGATATLGDIARCTRGIATGANAFFTLSESDRRRHGLDRRDLAWCVTKARQVPGDKLTPDCMRRLAEADQRIWLLDPRPRLSAAVRRYLAEGQRLGIPRRYLPAHRPIWYRPERRTPAPIWVTVFARGDFRFVRNTAGVLNLTAFHAISIPQPTPRRLRALFAYLTGPRGQDALRPNSRIYADGLLKVEPRDVLALPIPTDLLHLCRPQVSGIATSEE